MWWAEGALRTVFNPNEELTPHDGSGMTGFVGYDYSTESSRPVLSWSDCAR